MTSDTSGLATDLDRSAVPIRPRWPRVERCVDVADSERTKCRRVQVAPRPLLTRVVKETPTQNEDAHTPKPNEARPTERDKAAICALLVRDCFDSGESADVQLERPDDERARRGGEGADDADRDVLRAAGVPW